MIDGFSSWMQDYDSCIRLSCGGGGGFFLACKDFGRMLSLFIPRLHFFLKWRLACAHQFHSLGQDQSTVAHQAKTSVAECSLTSCMWACFQIASHTMPGQQHTQPSLFHWVKGACVYRCNLPPALLAEWPGSFTCHCGNTGMEQTLNKSRYTKLTLEKKVLQPPLPGFKLCTFWSRVRHP